MIDRRKIWRVADRANQGFVGLVQMLTRLVSWQRSHKEQPARLTIPADPKVYQALAAKVEQILNRNAGLGQPDAATIEDPEFKPKLRDLFHEDPGRRIAAVRFIRKRRYTAARSALEGILSVESSELVRSEIDRALTEL